MRKYKLTRFLEMLDNFETIHEEIEKKVNTKDYQMAKSLLANCQESAILVGNAIEESEEEGFITVSYLEEYCEKIFEIFENLSDGKKINFPVKAELNKVIGKVICSMRSDIHVKREAVFLPYKASMWDSLESIYFAAKEDPDCDVYVIPIPYYDKDSEGKCTALHYEAGLMPESIPITKYDEYDFSAQRPDMIFIHNPYDDINLVTSVPSFFYSNNLKQYTDNLVYVPYFATTGAISAPYDNLPVYKHADFIVIQSDDYKKFFHESVSQDKLISFGSPKFDAVIRKCENPPDVPPEWKEKIYDEAGNKKKVYFYNTSLNGMFADPTAFLKKMQYVFDTFKKHTEVCLLWRPHPLLATSFDRIGADYRLEYEKIKQAYLEEDFGIYDTTPSIENTIANCDVYVGDSATSVTALFGIVGKPLFILDNQISSLPKDNDWIGSILYPGFCQTTDGQYHDKFALGPENTLYFSPNNDYHYEFYLKLSDESEQQYQRAYEYGDKVYVFPSLKKHILVIDKNKNIRQIELQDLSGQIGAFAGLILDPNYAYICPNMYPALVRFDFETEEITYVNGFRDFNVHIDGNDRFFAAKWTKDGKFYGLSRNGNQVMIFDAKTKQVEVKEVGLSQTYYMAIFRNIENPEVWLLPLHGTVVTRWNIETNEIRRFDLNIDGLESMHRRKHVLTDLYMFGSAAFVEDEVIFAPYWGNKFVKLNPETGDVTEWFSPFDITFEDSSDYIKNYYVGIFIRDWAKPENYKYYNAIKREFYEINLQTKETKKIEYSYNCDDIFEHASGYGSNSEYLKYCVKENVFNTLEDLIVDSISGKQFDKKEQIEAYTKINASPEGDCGRRIYEFVS